MNLVQFLCSLSNINQLHVYWCWEYLRYHCAACPYSEHLKSTCPNYCRNAVFQLIKLKNKHLSFWRRWTGVLEFKYYSRPESMLHYSCRTFPREDAQRVGLSRDPEHGIVVHGAASRELPAPINTRTRPTLHIDQCNLRLCNCCMHVREVWVW